MCHAVPYGLMRGKEHICDIIYINLYYITLRLYLCSLFVPRRLRIQKFRKQFVYSFCLTDFYYFSLYFRRFVFFVHFFITVCNVCNIWVQTILSGCLYVHTNIFTLLWSNRGPRRKKVQKSDFPVVLFSLRISLGYFVAHIYLSWFASDNSLYAVRMKHEHF